MSELKKNEQESIENVDIETVLKGLEMNVVKLQEMLNKDADSLTLKEMRRVVKGIINYPDNPTLADKADRERKFIGAMFSLHESQVLLELNVIDNMRKEAVEQRIAEDEKLNEKGE